MTSREGLRRTRSLARLLLSTLLVAAGVVLVHLGASAQAQDVLAERELQYLQVRQMHQARVTQWHEVEQRWQRALDAVNAARRAGDSGRLEVANRRAYALSLELGALNLLVEEARARMEEARRLLREALDGAMTALDRQLRQPRSPEERRTLESRIAILDGQYRALGAEPAAGAAGPLVFYPSINVDARYGPGEIQSLVNLAQRRARDAEEAIVEVDATLERLRGRLQRQRLRDDSRAARDRFGDTEPPVVASRPGGRSEGVRPDAEQVPFDELPLEQQIEYLQSHRSQLELLRDQMRNRARTLQEHLTRIGGRGSDR